MADTPTLVNAICAALAALVLFPSLLATRQLRRPLRADLPVLLAISLFRMTALAAFMIAGLALVPAGRAIVLGYTTLFWVAPTAFLFLGERILVAVGGRIDEVHRGPGSLDLLCRAMLAAA